MRPLTESLAMPGSSRLRRSVLYMPGANSRALEKARTLPCDGVILDLEDAVAPDAKAKARQQIAEALTAGGYGTREVVVRINSLDGPWGREDLAAFASRRPDAILLPKVESPQQLCDLDQAMKKLGYDRETAIWAMMETPRGILAADRIAAGTDRLACFVMGTNDLAKDLRLAPTPAREGFATSFGLALLAARAFGLAILDGVYGDLQDAEALNRNVAKVSCWDLMAKHWCIPNRSARPMICSAPRQTPSPTPHACWPHGKTPKRKAKGWQRWTAK
nr:CoA ester lyase [Iodidimonas gelatinilytica]